MIRLANSYDFAQIWTFFKLIAQAGETYAYDRNISQQEAFHQWMNFPRQTFVFEKDGEILGSYYIKTNHAGAGAHVCNCGYMVSEAARGQGVAAQMCEHSQQIARELGYLAMQFNFVASAMRVLYDSGKNLALTLLGDYQRRLIIRPKAWSMLW